MSSPDPRVGEIYAVRTFRVNTDDGSLVPIAQPKQWRAWADGAAEAACARGRDHVAPHEGCRCGLYAFATAAEVGRQYPQAQRLLAIVACHGKVIAGRKGIRAQHARIVALWMSPAMSASLAGKVRARYARLPVYRDLSAMLAEFPPTRLETYAERRPGIVARAVFFACVAVLAGLAYVGGPLGERWQVVALLAALAGGGVSLGASLGARGIGGIAATVGLGVMFVGLAFSVRGVPVSFAAVPFLVIVCCYVAVAASQRVAIRWGPVSDSTLLYTPPLPHLSALRRTRQGNIITYFSEFGRPTTAVCIRRRRVRSLSSVDREAREAVIVDVGKRGSLAVTRCRRVGVRGWRVVGQQVFSRDAVESALGVAIS